MSHSTLTEILKDARTAFTAQRSPDDPVEINGGYCRQFAEFVEQEYDLPPNVEIIDAADVHTWLYYQGRHYDAEHPDGLSDIHDHPIWKRIMDDRLDFAVESTEHLDRSVFASLD